MKPGRSNQFTTGLCNTFKGTTAKTLFFELDHYDPITEIHENREQYHIKINKVRDVYEFYQLDYMTHKTQNGIHFLSPTILSKEKWKKVIDELRDLNRKCPMNTLRVEPNKYPNESEFWYRVESKVWDYNQPINSSNMCNYLNKIFGRLIFVGNPEMDYDLKIVRYPLPEKR